MKHTLLAATVLAFGMSAFAAGPTATATTTTTAPGAAPAAAAATTAAPSTSAAVSAPASKKVAWAQAKEECLKENSSLKGKALRSCVKAKQGK